LVKKGQAAQQRLPFFMMGRPCRRGTADPRHTKALAEESQRRCVTTIKVAGASVTVLKPTPQESALVNAWQGIELNKLLRLRPI
jgi:hypothetical protein